MTACPIHAAHSWLADLGLRLPERFLYEYDFLDYWQHDLRLEQILPLNRPRYPVCIRGRRAAPPENSGGPWAFLKLKQRYSTVSIANRMPPTAFCSRGLDMPRSTHSNATPDRAPRLLPDMSPSMIRQDDTGSPVRVTVPICIHCARQLTLGDTRGATQRECR
jgi:hypothetical protein